jgi:hypothetical protein
MLPLERDQQIVISQVQPRNIQDCHSCVAANPVFCHVTPHYSETMSWCFKGSLCLHFWHPVHQEELHLQCTQSRKSSPLVACPQDAPHSFKTPGATHQMNGASHSQKIWSSGPDKRSQSSCVTWFSDFRMVEMTTFKEGPQCATVHL